MDASGNINARHRRVINLANPRSNRDAVNLSTCRDLISLWLPKRKDQITSQVFTSLNQSVLTDMMDPINGTDGVNKQYLEKRMDEHSRDIVGKVIFTISTLVQEQKEGKNYSDPQVLKNTVLKRIGLGEPEGIKENDEAQTNH